MNEQVNLLVLDNSPIRILVQKMAADFIGYRLVGADFVFVPEHVFKDKE